MRNERTRIQHARSINWGISAFCYHRGKSDLCPPETRQDPLLAAKWLLKQLEDVAAKNPTKELTQEVRRVKDIIAYYEGEN